MLKKHYKKSIIGKIECKQNTADNKHIYNHLYACNQNFIPKLSDRVDLTEYSKKLHEKADNFEAWADNALIGLLSIYVDSTNFSAFISNASSSLDYQKMGITTTLMEKAFSYLKKNKIRKVRLEVHNSNLPALKLYQKFSFSSICEKFNIITMELHFDDYISG